LKLSLTLFNTKCRIMKQASKQSNYITRLLPQMWRGNKLKDIHPTYTNKSSRSSLERLLTITDHMWCWLGFSWLIGDGGFCNHVSHNIWNHVWSNHSKSRGEGEGEGLGLGGVIFSIYSAFFWTGSVQSGLTGSCITKQKTKPNQDFF